MPLMIRKIFIFIFVSITFCCFAQERGYATYYSSKLKGRHTSDGGKYHPDSMTCAHRNYPLGTILKVRNPKNDREVIVKVTDRGPFQKRLDIDLSYLAAYTLDIVRSGISMVEITKLDGMPPKFPLLVPLPIPLRGINIERLISIKPLM